MPCKHTKLHLNSREGEDDEILVLDKENETKKLGDVEKLKLISLMNDKICLWANGKFFKPKRTRQFYNHSMRRLSASNLPVSSFLGTNIMLQIDVALQVVPCNMYVAIKKSSKVAQKVDSCNMSRKHDPVLRRNRCWKLTRGTPPLCATRTR